MSFDNYMQSIGNIDTVDMSENEKEGAVNAWLLDSEKKPYIMDAISKYLIDDHHIASAQLLPDAECGRAFKHLFYSAFESDMQDTIDGILP